MGITESASVNNEAAMRVNRQGIAGRCVYLAFSSFGGFDA